jgi:hypothetical protein
MTVFEKKANNFIEDAQILSPGGVERPPPPKRQETGKFLKFIYAVGGANVELLEQYPTEKKKFIAIAAGVFITAGVSMLTMGIAIFSVARKNMVEVIDGVEKAVTVPFSPLAVTGILFAALIWGGIIFAIDWALVSTIRKDAKTTFKFILAVAWRLVVAVFLSFTVSRPLEVIVFRDYLPAIKNESQAEYLKNLETDIQEKIGAAEEKLKGADENLRQWNLEREGFYAKDPLVIDLRNKREQLTAQYDRDRPVYEEANRRSWNERTAAEQELAQITKEAALFENEALNQTGRRRLAELQETASGQKKRILALNNEMAQRTRYLNSLRAQRQDIEERLTGRYLAIDGERALVTRELIDERDRLERELDELKAVAGQEGRRNALASQTFSFDNLVANIMALGPLLSDSGSFAKSGITRQARQLSILLMVLVMIIDTSPIVIKIFSRRGPYEYALEQIEENERFRLKTDAAVWRQYYPALAAMFKVRELKEKDVKAMTDMHIQFYASLCNIQNQVEQHIHEIDRKTANEDNEEIKKIRHDGTQEILALFNETRNQMMADFKSFIRSPVFYSLQNAAAKDS